MKRTTTQNDIQVILRDYLGNRKVLRVAKKVYEVMKPETAYSYNGKNFFVREDERATLVFTTDVTVKNAEVEKAIKKILSYYLKGAEVQECFEQIELGYRTLLIEGANSDLYTDLLKYKYINYEEGSFLQELKKIVHYDVKKVENFKVPVYDPSIDENGYLKFIPGCKPATGYSYLELEYLAGKNGVQLGTKEQYILFAANIIYRMIQEGYTMRKAFYEVCYDSRYLGHYKNSPSAKNNFELTGSRMIAGKCDIGNTFKILKKDNKTGFYWLVSDSYASTGSVTSFSFSSRYNIPNQNGVGWFVSKC